MIGANLNEMSQKEISTRSDTHLKSGQYYPHINGSYDEDGLNEENLVDVNRKCVGYLSYQTDIKPSPNRFKIVLVLPLRPVVRFDTIQI